MEILRGEFAVRDMVSQDRVLDIAAERFQTTPQVAWNSDSSRKQRADLFATTKWSLVVKDSVANQEPCSVQR